MLNIILPQRYKESFKTEILKFLRIARLMKIYVILAKDGVILCVCVFVCVCACVWVCARVYGWVGVCGWVCVAGWVGVRVGGWVGVGMADFNLYVQMI